MSDNNEGTEKPPLVPPRRVSSKPSLTKKRVSENISKAVTFFETKTDNTNPSSTPTKVLKNKPKSFGNRKRSGTFQFSNGLKYHFGQRTNEDGVELAASALSSSSLLQSNDFSLAFDKEAEVVIVDKSFANGSLQNLLPSTKVLFDKRKTVKETYLAKQRKLQNDYEKKVSAEHMKFLASHKSLATEKDNNEFKSLENAWLSIPITVWDNLVVKSHYDKNTSATLWSQIRTKTDLNASNNNNNTPNFKAKNSSNSRLSFSKEKTLKTLKNLRFSKRLDKSIKKLSIKETKSIDLSNISNSENDKVLLSKEGEATTWALNLFSSEDRLSKSSVKKQEKTRNRLATSLLKILQLEDNRENRNRVFDKLASNHDDILFSAKLLLKEDIQDGNANINVENKIQKLNKAKKEQEKQNRRVIVRVTKVDKENENIKVVMVLDRNLRPIAGGLEKIETVIKKEYSGNDKVLSKQKSVISQSSENTEMSQTAESVQTVDNAEKVEETRREGESFIPGYRSTEDEKLKAYEYTLDISELLTLPNITVLESENIEAYKSLFNSAIPHITYQQVSGFSNNHNNNNNNSRVDNSGDFQLVDIGFRLNLEPLEPLEEYIQEYRNGTLFSVKHTLDGLIRFVGFNETGFGFFEDKPISVFTQEITSIDKKEAGKIIGTNILHMTLFDTNDEVSFDTLYLENGQSLDDNTLAKVFSKDSLGNRLSYRIVGKNGQIEAVLYPFQGRVKRASVVQYDVNFLKKDVFVTISTNSAFNTFGATSSFSETENTETLRLAIIKFVPLGIVLGSSTGIDDSKAKFEPTVFLEMLRQNVRNFAEVSGLVDVEILVEGGSLLEKPRQESWPVEYLFEANKKDVIYYEKLKNQKLSQFEFSTSEAKNVISTVKNFLANKSDNRKDKETFFKRAESMKEKLKTSKESCEKNSVNDLTENEFKSICEEIEQMMKNVDQSVEAFKRAEALNRRSKQRESIKKDI